MLPVLLDLFRLGVFCFHLLTLLLTTDAFTTTTTIITISTANIYKKNNFSFNYNLFCCFRM